MKSKRNEVKHNAFEMILGRVNLERHNWLLSLALYGEHNYRKPKLEELNELLLFNKTIDEYISKHYTKTEIIEGEDFMVYEDYPNIPVSRWNLYKEHINRVKENYVDLLGIGEIINNKLFDFQI